MFQLLQLVAFIIAVIVHALFVKPFAYSFSCRNGVEFDYPFYEGGLNELYGNPNGYTGLEINCADDGRSVINISSHLYFVQSIDYASTKFRVVDADIDGQECPQPRRNFSLQSTPSLDYYNYVRNITILYNCSRHPKDVEQNLPCLDDHYNTSNKNTTVARSFIFYPNEIPKGFNCEETVVVPVSAYSDYSQAFRLGFDLIWSTPNECKDCEGSGGQCSIGTTERLPDCDCKDGTFTSRRICLNDRTPPQQSKNETVTQAAQTNHLVLDNMGWTIPQGGAIDYTTWAAGKNFTVGDTLVFNFISGQHDVAQVTKGAFDACTTTNPITVLTTGPANITLDTPGDHYYLCTFSAHCSSGQKLAIDVSGSTRPKGISTGLKVVIGVVAGVGGLLLLLLIIYRRLLYSLYYSTVSHWRNTIRSPTNVEIFLESCGRLPVQRYKYSGIKKMTSSFKETLGQGGYGSVFKGKLPDGCIVAVKVLNESKGNGEDFMNEIGAIGWTNHVNVVSLLGFCSEGTKRALVYEFMPNGSLERFIYNEKNSSTSTSPLGREKLYQIALGTAKGLEYLHRGCNTRILHFDIKPHNILLDQNFCPKISDFGLAKLCPTRESIVSMLVARGTIGYIAPEVYCRNFGRVSHKSDVYSYGMMVLEMIGGRKNIDATVEKTSEIYFPPWIHNHYKREIKVEGYEKTFEEETTKKMIIVALWCIQTQPADRPSINKVVEMLEGKTEELQMPPNPFQDPPSRSSP